MNCEPTILAAWEPHNLFHCLDYDPLTWAIIALCLGVMEGYIEIAYRTWLPAMKAASDKARQAFSAMLFIFIFCGIAGYGTRALAAWYPKTAYISLVFFLLALNVLNRMFLRSRRGKNFQMIGVYEKIGQQLSAPAIAKMNNDDLAVHIRRVLAESIGRQIGMIKL